MARLYANENVPRPVFLALRQLGHDVLTVQETGKGCSKTPDEEVLAFAVAERRAVLTINRRHFRALHQQHPGHAGIVICSLESDPKGQAQRIHQALCDASRLAGELIRVNRPMR